MTYTIDISDYINDLPPEVKTFFMHDFIHASADAQICQFEEKILESFSYKEKVKFNTLFLLHKEEVKELMSYINFCALRFYCNICNGLFEAILQDIYPSVEILAKQVAKIIDDKDALKKHTNIFGDDDSAWQAMQAYVDKYEIKK